MKRDLFDHLDSVVQAWLAKHYWRIMAVLVAVLVWVVVSTDTGGKQSSLRTIRWNYANASVPLWNYQNYSPGVVPVIWNPSNPSYRTCSKYTGPNYRPDGDNGYNPAPENLPWNPQPYCWTCHGNTYVAYYRYTTAAHSGGHPVAYGDR